MKCFNPEVSELLVQSGATTVEGITPSLDMISLTRYQFEDFMVRFARYVQARQNAIVSHDRTGHTYMGDDTPSWKMIDEVEQSLFGDE